MTLDDAIKHCQQVANESNCECAKEHKQLAQWLQELKKFKKMQTNEEWFCNLDTEDKAREISDMTAQGYWSEELVERWLKEKHKQGRMMTSAT